MSLRDKATRLFNCIGQIYSIDLPVNRDVTKYNKELWWQALLTPSTHCKIKEFYSGLENNTESEADFELTGEPWLSVTKRGFDDPPLPSALIAEWIEASKNPTKEPQATPSILRSIKFEADPRRTAAFQAYIISWNEWRKSNIGHQPRIPDILTGWLDTAQAADTPPAPIPLKEIEEKFEDEPRRTILFKYYIEDQWGKWSERVKPQFHANILFDELFGLFQRLSVEGERIEISWGHLFLAWSHSPGNTIYHPLFLSPMNLSYEPERRHICISPSQTLPTRLELECLFDLDYPLKDQLERYCQEINNSETPPDVWNHGQMRGIAAAITGYLSTELADKTILYTDAPLPKPSVTSYPVIFNAPVIFVRERTRRFWVEDAKKVAQTIAEGADISPFIRALVADPQRGELPDIDDHFAPEDETEALLPLEFNDQQKEIAEKLGKHYGVLVQGPPGTGKSHTIANIVSSLLARGKRVLVTSQTENALKVLREFLPKSIRSLCVSQLGNDTEAKGQLKEAVDSIGQRLGEKGDQGIEQQIRQLRRDLREIREEQARLRHKIKEWVELDLSAITIGDNNFTALEAAKYCSENEAAHSWLPDDIPPETEPPLSHEELRELCAFFQEISPDDRRSSLQYLPDPDKKPILRPEEFQQLLAQRRSYDALLDETWEARRAWGERLRSASPEEIKKGIAFLEELLVALKAMDEPWQAAILELMLRDESQEVFWRELFDKGISYKTRTWQAYQTKTGYKIEIGEMPLSAIDIDAALNELQRNIENGKALTGWLAKIRLSKPAKMIFNLVKVDGNCLTTIERILVVRAYYSYNDLLKKIETHWNQYIKNVNGPELDLSVAMPLAIVDLQFKKLELIVNYKDHYAVKNDSLLSSLGCINGICNSATEIENYLKTMHGQIALLEKEHIDQQLRIFRDFLSRESKKENAHNIWLDLGRDVKELAPDSYERTFNELLRLSKLIPRAQRLDYLAGELLIVAPRWYGILEKEAGATGAEALKDDWAADWTWKRLNGWLERLHRRESVESLQVRRERTRRKERELIEELVTQLTWQRQIDKVKDYHYQALTAWAAAMRKYGKGSGKYAQKWLAAAAKAMRNAVDAVPAWIMPLHRVIQSFPAKPGIFDVIIIDEASQCDLRALPVLFRAKKILVVGDPEQISPSNIGIDHGKVFELIRGVLYDIPYAMEAFSINNSLFDSVTIKGLFQRTMLTEHFRCVAPIIEFNNDLCPSYAGKLEPLRQPNPVERLDPCIIPVYVNNGFKNDSDVNEPEAEALVEMLIQCCKDERYAQGGKDNRKRTMGVISLLGEKQAKYINNLIAQRLDETERAERRIICGDAYAFQGDERDVMFLSLVIAPNASFSALVRDSDRQRFNVAASRARDQVFLFHSVKLEDIRNHDCVRYKLLRWYQNPMVAEMEAGLEILKKKADSEFEIEVGVRIIKSGYKVIPQYQPLPRDFRYKIDLVVQGEKNRVAVECDGDRWHGPEKWEYDQRREAQLRRAGLKFWRISGSAFYRHKEKSLESLWQFLDDEGIERTLIQDNESTPRNNIIKPMETHTGKSEDAEQNTTPDNGQKTVIIPDGEDHERVKLGDTVKVYDEVTDRKIIYRLAQPGKPGHVSPESPIGRALLGARLGDFIEITTPGDIRSLEILDIQTAQPHFSQRDLFCTTT